MVCQGSPCRCASNDLLNQTDFLIVLFQVRTTIRYDYSYISAAAVKLNDEILEVAGWGDYFLNGVENGGIELPQLTFAGYGLTHEIQSEKEHVFTIAITETEKITLKTFKDWVSVKFLGPSSSHFSSSTGLFGQFVTGEKLARDGVTIIEDVTEFGSEWQVSDTDPNLFETARAPQYPEVCRLPDPSKTTQRRLGDSITYEAAAQACAHWGVEKEGCIEDIMKSGDMELAEAGGY
jgi:hypothetical protein